MTDVPIENLPEAKPHRRRRGVDIGDAFSYAFKDKDWLQKLALHGVFLLIPILGSIILLGWQRAIFERVRAGQTGLPELDLNKHINEGLAPFGATCNVYVPYFFVGFMAQILILGGMLAAPLIAAATDEPALAVIGIVLTLIGYGVIFAALALMWVLLPEFKRRGFKGDPLPLIRLGPSLEALKTHPSAYATVCIFSILITFIGQMGFYLFCVGFIVTIPWAYATTTHLLAQFDLLVDPSNHETSPDEAVSVPKVEDSEGAPESTVSETQEVIQEVESVSSNNNETS